MKPEDGLLSWDLEEKGDVFLDAEGTRETDDS